MVLIYSVALGCVVSITNFGVLRGRSNRLEKLSRVLGVIVGAVGVEGAAAQDGVVWLGDPAGAGATWSTLLAPSLFYRYWEAAAAEAV